MEEVVLRSNQSTDGDVAKRSYQNRGGCVVEKKVG